MRSSHLVLFAALGACGGDSDPSDSGATGDTGEASTDLAIAGTYLDGFGSEHVVTNETWTQTYSGYDALVFAITQYDNTLRYVVAQNGPDNGYGADAWSRFDWSEAEDGHLYYCQTAFDAVSEQAAADSPRPDDSDPATTGCGGFSWTDLTP